MMCLGFEPGAAGWKAQTSPLSYGGTLTFFIYEKYSFVVDDDDAQRHSFN